MNGLKKLKELNIEMFGDGKSPHDPNDTWFINVDLPTQENFDEFKLNGKTPPNGHLGRLTLHFVHYQNPWIGNALCFVEYLTQNQEAFNKYRDVKIEGARLQSANSEKSEEQDPTKPSPFKQYKMHKAAVVSELMEESKHWREAGNFNLPKILSESH